MTEPKHISQLSAADRALAAQQIGHALLAIVASQGRPVTIPVSQLDDIAATHRLKIEQENGYLVLTAEEAAPAEIIEPRPHETDAYGGKH